MNSFWKTNATEFVVADWQQLKFVWRHCISCVFGTRTLFRTYVCEKKTIQTCSKFVKLDTNHKTKHEFNCVFYQSISFKNPLYVKLYLQIRIFSYGFFSQILHTATDKTEPLPQFCKSICLRMNIHILWPTFFLILTIRLT